jgi:hypothetical protein
MKRSYVVACLAGVAAVAIVSPALGGPSLQSLVKQEVAKQLASSAKSKKGPRGPAGPAGPAGRDGTNGIDGTARAYARVSPDGLSGCAPNCFISISKGVSSVTHPATGVYCVTAPGIDASTVSAAVTVDWGKTSGPEGNASAMVNANCTASTAFQVITQRLPQTGTISAAPDDDVGFTIVIP